MELKIITLDMIRGWCSCYDPSEIVPEGTEGTILDAIDLYEGGTLPPQDFVWLACQGSILPDELKSAFARQCALSVIHLWDAPQVVKRYLETGNESLKSAARNAAWDAAWDAAWNGLANKLLKLIKSEVR